MNFSDGEGRGDIFEESLNLAAQRSLQYVFVVEEILQKCCVVDGDTLGGAAMGFGVNTLGSLKVGGCCGFSAEEALEKMVLSWKSALRVMVSDGGSRGFLLIFLNAAVKSLAVAILMLVAVAVFMMSLWGNQEKCFPIRSELVAGIKNLWQR